MIQDVYKHIRNLEDYLGLDHLPWELIDDPQEYYQFLVEDHPANHTYTDGLEIR